MGWEQGFLFTGENLSRGRQAEGQLEGRVEQGKERLAEENKIFHELSRAEEIGSGSGWFDPNL